MFLDTTLVVNAQAHTQFHANTKSGEILTVVTGQPEEELPDETSCRYTDSLDNARGQID